MLGVANYFTAVELKRMASQVANIIKLTEKTSGRDKLCRIVQYGSKFVYWVLEQESLSPQLITKLKALESSISTARKCKAYPTLLGIGVGKVCHWHVWKNERLAIKCHNEAKPLHVRPRYIYR